MRRAGGAIVAAARGTACVTRVVGQGLQRGEQRMNRFEGVTVLTEANVYFDGKCVSHTIMLPDGSRKTLGVILAARLRFETRAPERMEIVAGSCRYRMEGAEYWQRCEAGGHFDIPADSAFDIDVEDRVDYICHFG
jgi:purine/pyrimidine-nucleoside phosphorylase